MIFVFLEDGTMDVVADLQEARRQYEGVDIDAGIYDFYDEDGHYLEPSFTVPNRYGRFLWIIPWSEPGVFELRHKKTPHHEDPIWLALYETGILNPNAWFKSIDEIKDYLRKRHVTVDRPDEV